MKKLNLEMMMCISGGQQLVLVSGSGSNFNFSSYQNSVQLSPFHYSAWDCVGFFGGLFGMTAAAFGTGGIGLILGGLASFSGMVASAGNCEGYLNQGG